MPRAARARAPADVPAAAGNNDLPARLHAAARATTEAAAAVGAVMRTTTFDEGKLAISQLRAAARSATPTLLHDIESALPSAPDLERALVATIQLSEAISELNARVSAAPTLRDARVLEGYLHEGTAAAAAAAHNACLLVHSLFIVKAEGRAPGRTAAALRAALSAASIVVEGAPALLRPLLEGPPCVPDCGRGVHALLLLEGVGILGSVLTFAAGESGGGAAALRALLPPARVAALLELALPRWLAAARASGEPEGPRQRAVSRLNRDAGLVWGACVMSLGAFHFSDDEASTRNWKRELARTVRDTPEALCRVALLARAVAGQLAAAPRDQGSWHLGMFLHILSRLANDAVPSAEGAAVWVIAQLADGAATAAGALYALDEAPTDANASTSLALALLLNLAADVGTSWPSGADAPLMVAGVAAAAEAVGAGLAQLLREPRLRAVTRRRAALPLSNDWAAVEEAPAPASEAVLAATDACVALAAGVEALGRLPEGPPFANAEPAQAQVALALRETATYVSATVSDDSAFASRAPAAAAALVRASGAVAQLVAATARGAPSAVPPHIASESGAALAGLDGCLRACMEGQPTHELRRILLANIGAARALSALAMQPATTDEMAVITASYVSFVLTGLFVLAPDALALAHAAGGLEVLGAAAQTVLGSEAGVAVDQPAVGGGRAPFAVSAAAVDFSHTLTTEHRAGLARALTAAGWIEAVARRAARDARGEQPRAFAWSGDSPPLCLVVVLEACALDADLELPALDDPAALEALADQFVARGAELRAEYEAGAGAARLEAARALAARPCANPACARAAGLDKATAKAEGGMSFSLCSGCCAVRYCCRECQRADWRAHKAYCGLLRAEREARLAERAAALAL